MNAVIKLAGDITPEEGENIFRTNIFIEMMSAVEQGSRIKSKPLQERMEMSLFGKNPSPRQVGVLPFGKGEKYFYVVFVPGDKRYGYYSEIRANCIFSAVSAAFEKFGCSSWDYLRKEKPEKLKEWIVPPEPADEEEADILEELESEEKSFEKDSGRQAMPPTVTFTEENIPGIISAGKEKQPIDKTAYLRMYGLNERGERIRD